MIIDLIVVFISIFLLSKQIYDHNWYPVIVFVVSMLLLFAAKQPNYISVGVAAVMLGIVTINSIESFKDDKSSHNNKEQKTHTKSKRKIKVSEDEDDVDENDKNEIGDSENTDDENENENDDDENDQPDDDEVDELPEIDIGKTFRNAYANLNPKQIENMTKDTKELVKTQSNLISTLKNLEPVVTQGISLLDKFQGVGSTAKMFKDMSMKNKLPNLLEKK